MKLCVFVFALVAAAAAYEEPTRYYHETVGIAEAARIKALESSMEFDGSRIAGGSSAKPGQVPYMRPSTSGLIAQASGFGRTGDGVDQGITTGQTLSTVSLQVIRNWMCDRTFDIVTDSILCTSGGNGRSTCGGDSGGPLQIDNQLIGITSFGAAAGCTRGFPAGFTRVTSFASWIQAHM